MLSRSRPRVWAVEAVPFQDIIGYIEHLWPGDKEEFLDVILQLDEHYLARINTK